MNSEKYYPIDLHIHSALSSCASNEMTPKNIISHAITLGFKAISITDHNSCLNVSEAINEASDKDILIVPAIEAESREGVHALLYFANLEKCEEMGEILENSLPKTENRIKYFGNQLIIKNNKVSEHPYLLSQPSSLTLKEIYDYTKKLKGVFVLAHIHRRANGIISTLGFIPDNIKCETLELSRQNFKKYKQSYSKYNIVINSDAHKIEDIYKSPVTAIKTDRKIDINFIMSTLEKHYPQRFMFF
jgi:PHP family Zn ribbon phosphoesterase